MSLKIVLESLLQQPGSSIRLEPGKLGLAYSEEDGFHTLALSRIDVEPGPREVQIVIDTLSRIGFDTSRIRRITDVRSDAANRHTHHIIRLSWPDENQLVLFELESRPVSDT